jgi:hypothetical protein
MSRTTKPRHDKDHQAVIAAKATAAAEKKLASEARKLSAKDLQEKKKHLLASRKAERKATKAAALRKKANAVTAPTVAPPTSSTPGLARSGYSGICSHLPKKVKLTSTHTTSSIATAIALETVHPRARETAQRRGCSSIRHLCSLHLVTL